MKVKPAGKDGGVVVEMDAKDTPMLERAQRSTQPSPFKLKKVLVPMDFSECSLKALDYAIAFARQFQASLVLLHVVQFNYMAGAEYGGMDYPGIEKELRESAQKQLEDMAARCREQGVSLESVIKTGRAVPEIVAIARDTNADLIVISTHGYTGLKHVFLGSTAENVVRYAPCPVLTVRENEHDFLTN